MKISKAERAVLAKEIQRGFVQGWARKALAKKKQRELQRQKRGAENRNWLLAWKSWAARRNWLW